MAYKRQSPMPIVEGGTNSTTYATQYGVGYYDGTQMLVTGNTPMGNVLTSNGAGVAPSYQPMTGGTGVSVVGGGESQVSPNRYLGATGSDVYSCIFLFRNPGNDSQAQNQTICPVSGTFSNLYVYISQNNSTTNAAATLYVNGIATSITVTITAAMTGLFSDTVNTAAITAGQSVQMMVQQTTTGNLYGNFSLRFS